MNSNELKKLNQKKIEISHAMAEILADFTKNDLVLIMLSNNINARYSQTAKHKLFRSDKRLSEYNWSYVMRSNTKEDLIWTIISNMYSGYIK